MPIVFHPHGAVEDKRGGALHTAMQAFWELSLGECAHGADGVSEECVVRLDGGGGFCY